MVGRCGRDSPRMVDSPISDLVKAKAITNHEVSAAVEALLAKPDNRAVPDRRLPA